MDLSLPFVPDLQHYRDLNPSFSLLEHCTDELPAHDPSMMRFKDASRLDVLALRRLESLKVEALCKTQGKVTISTLLHTRRFAAYTPLPRCCPKNLIPLNQSVSLRKWQTCCPFYPYRCWNIIGSKSPLNKHSWLLASQSHIAALVLWCKPIGDHTPT
ncbi:uncharacterized protein EI90DRAFT_645012 [Cantharellus anzutake]|uniref:uncharacterized protein n=1 Tax=Cantharellus anzutake TaxID=1750568 RepID=UPI0019076B98|nr:uncharacterized protein EI90DRAFT_645012 [Cantharellus anzutake]KAF8333242.1 hypothetical protein EI90DRAFT_645012 [Cantharellus anzutake]